MAEIDSRQLSFPPGTYLTDGKKLMRVEHVIHGADRDAIVEIEDCRSFELTISSTAELLASGVRPVSGIAAGVSGER